MSEFELSDFSSMTDAQISPRSKDTSLCWHCKKDSVIDMKKKNLISPCKCANDFIHVHCLEFLANTRNMLDCPRCNARYPLEMQPSLLKMLRKVCVPFFMILFVIFVNFMIGLTYWSLSDVPDIHLSSIIIKIISLSVFIWFIYMTVRKIIDLSRRIYQFYDQWYKSDYGWKLIKRYNVNIQNIEE